MDSALVILAKSEQKCSLSLEVLQQLLRTQFLGSAYHHPQISICLDSLPLGQFSSGSVASAVHVLSLFRFIALAGTASSVLCRIYC